MMNRAPDIAYWDTSVGQVGAHVEERRVTFQGKRYELTDAQELAEALADAIDWLNGDGVVAAQIEPDRFADAYVPVSISLADDVCNRIGQADSIGGNFSCDRTAPKGLNLAQHREWLSTHRHHATVTVGPPQAIGEWTWWGDEFARKVIAP